MILSLNHETFQELAVNQMEPLKFNVIKMWQTNFVKNTRSLSEIKSEESEVRCVA